MAEPRFGESPCPACGFALVPISASHPEDAPLTTGERVPPISACPACGGVWFDWWAGETATLAQGLLALPRPTHTVPRLEPHCPRDGARLVAQAYLDSGPVVRRCSRCMGLFAKRFQIEELARFVEQLPEPPAPIEDRTILSRLWRLLT